LHNNRSCSGYFERLALIRNSLSLRCLFSSLFVLLFSAANNEDTFRREIVQGLISRRAGSGSPVFPSGSLTWALERSRGENCRRSAQPIFCIFSLSICSRLSSSVCENLIFDSAPSRRRKTALFGARLMLL